MWHEDVGSNDGLLESDKSDVVWTITSDGHDKWSVNNNAALSTKDDSKEVEVKLIMYMQLCIKNKR